MTHAPSRLLVNAARIILMLFALGLLSPAAQACALFKSQVAMSSMTSDNPCSISGETVKMNTACTVMFNSLIEDCVVQPQATVSTATTHIPPGSTLPYFIIEHAAWVPHSSSITLATLLSSTSSPPPQPVPLSILHCSFQI